jgi:nitric oxide reductase subunit B
MTGKRIAFGFWLLSLSCLIVGLFFGMSGSLQYILPGFLKDQFSFAHMRPLHVFLITQWISSAATGSMYYFIPEVGKRKLFSPILAQIHLLMQVVIVMVAVSDFFIGNFSGREYMEFPLWMAGVMILGWIFALINFIGTVRPKFDKAPVYVWSWATGLVFFIITITEATLWQFDHFNANIIRDITIQWKALGSMVGAWNMLIYGSAVYVMCRISKSEEMARSKPAFFFYFLGLTNLMFNWGHHTYVVPASPVIRITAYVISMTELLILFNMIWKWSKTLTKEDKEQHLSYGMLKMTDNWILLNLTLAILISIPALNQYTHGTHVTVAHAMGATIGINTTILLAAGFYILFLERRLQSLNITGAKQFVLGFFNVSLLVFWISLIGSGIAKAASVSENRSFAEIMIKLKPWFHLFSFSGFLLTIAIVMLAAPLIRFFVKPRIAVQKQVPVTSVWKTKGVEVIEKQMEEV